jgi:hypothetical protein
MTFQQDIIAIRKRISEAASERDTWQAAGRQEKYLEASIQVETLQMELGERLRQPDRSLPPAPARAPGVS